MTIYVLSYSDGYYPEDDCILGVYTSEEKALSARNQIVSTYSEPFYKANKMYYKITEHLVDGEPNWYF